MKQPFIKTMLIVQICLACAGNAGSEILRSVKVESREAWQVDSNAGITKKIQKQKTGRRKGIVLKGLKDNNKGYIILAIVVLSICAIIFGGIGLIFLVGAFEYIGDGLAFIYFLFAAGGLSLALLCLKGIIKRFKYLRKSKYGEERPMENMPRRPPTKKTNQ